MNNKTLFVIGVLILVLGVGFVAYNTGKNNQVKNVVVQQNPIPTSIPEPIPTPNPTQKPSNKTITTSLGQQFTLKQGQTAKISSIGLEVEITEFYNSPCTGQCVWSGVGLGFEYRLNGEVQKGITLVQAFGYQTTIIKTDYETYANLIVEKIK
jgi:hypothetical protein